MNWIVIEKRAKGDKNATTKRQMMKEMENIKNCIERWESVWSLFSVMSAFTNDFSIFHLNVQINVIALHTRPWSSCCGTWKKGHSVEFLHSFILVLLSSMPRIMTYCTHTGTDIGVNGRCATVDKSQAYILYICIYWRMHQKTKFNICFCSNVSFEF